jgi:integrase
VRKVHFILSGALERAVRWRHLGVNRAALAVAPSPASAAPDPPSAAEAALLLNAAWCDPDWGLLLWLTMVTGLRRGELSALRWAHVDFNRGTLMVQRANAQPRSGVREKETKTGQHRRIALDQRTVALVTAHRDGVTARCAALGCEPSVDSWVFSPAPDGSSPHPPRSLTQKYRRQRSRRIRSFGSFRPYLSGLGRCGRLGRLGRLHAGHLHRRGRRSHRSHR